MNDLEVEARKYFNAVVLTASGELGRLIGYGEDDDDCYFIVQHMRPHVTPVWNTCVGGFIPLERLKGQGYVRSTSGEDWDDYYRLNQLLRLNGAPEAEEFLSVKERTL